ncbi:xanthine dehydrogenase family protein molybdopterin-binding subunit [Enterocloster lavalensis]|uniref:xanthine dehydrogenase family protein molybdopterin-binding subunit n=1 Tax=Enterocloster lavalensis TaxID=460384 RepID=UPI002666D923|nr:xanthine dehydrogenase family protein molybdopterin-binding subunit [Enterocloster lavalensis]
MAEHYVGLGLGRSEGMDKASGRALYAGDYREEGMLELALVRSPVSHGILEELDFSALPKDVLVFTAKDLAVNVVEDVIEDQPVLADRHVRFKGEPVAIVAAATRERAREAAALVKVVCRPLVVVRDVADAANPEFPALHGDGNLLVDFENEKGSVEQGFADSALILEQDFETPVQDHGYMEPEACFARIDGEGRLLAYTSTQNVFHDHRMICRALGLASDQVRVKAATVGGGFGGKDGNTAQIFAAAVAWLTKRPAKLVFDRRESLETSYKRHGVRMHVKMGFSRDGRILAFDGTGDLDTGAYAGLGPAVLGLFTEHFAGPYDIPNVHIKSRLWYTNKPAAHAMRGFGAPQGAFATETLISRAAGKLELDPIEIRLKNALETGKYGALGQKMEHCVDFKGALELIRASDLWKSREANRDPYVGYGIAGGHLSCGLGKNIPDTASVVVEETKPGYYRIRVGFVDIGQGSRTALKAMAADALETDLDHIEMIMSDTAETLDCGSAAGSRSTFIAGNALLAAVKEFRKKRVEEGGAAPLAATGHASFPESAKAFSTPGFPHAMYTFIAQAVKLRLDPVTGNVILLDVAAATEAGRIINPLSMAGQIQGGVAMSVGYALGENCVFEDGRLLNADFSTYLMPTSLDVPHITSYHVDAYEQAGPMGVKGAAEVSTVSIAPAIGGAIEQISGARLNSLPFDIDKILQAMEKKEEKQ